MKKGIIISIIGILCIVIILSISFFTNSEKNKLLATENKYSNTIDLVQKTENNNYNEKNIVLSLESDLDYALDVSDNQIRRENAEYIIIGRLNSIDGSTNYNEKQNEYTAIFTYGQIDVISVLQGDIKNSKIPFIRLGGEISFSEYEKGLTERQKEKTELVSSLSEDEKETSYVYYSPSGDIKLEEGKYYLMYMNYNADYDKYMCTYMQYGTREVDSNSLNNVQTISEIDNNTSEIKVKNNDTGEWENLSDVL